MSLLPNHLRAHRKRLGLSQEDVAFLLGMGDGAKVCRDERFARRTSLETALAYEAVYKRPVSELFAGLYERIEEEVAARSKILAQRAEHRKPNRRTARQRDTPADLAVPPSEPSINQSPT
jgi:transcriptional regulator with XRE-family HTH domain